MGFIFNEVKMDNFLQIQLSEWKVKMVIRFILHLKTATNAQFILNGMKMDIAYLRNFEKLVVKISHN